MPGSERRREIRRRRARRKKTLQMIERVKSGALSKTEAVRKLRRMSPGADVVIAREGWQ